MRPSARAISLADGVTHLRVQVSGAFAEIGRTEVARKILDEAESSWKSRTGASVWIAGGYACMNEIQAAFDWLEKAVHERGSS
jgi:hypothetical protein